MQEGVLWEIFLESDHLEVQEVDAGTMDIEETFHDRTN